MSLAMRMFLVVWPVAVPAARDHRDYAEALDAVQKEFEGTSGDNCDAVARKLEGVRQALTDLSEAHTHLSVLLDANWARFFGGSLHDDVSSAMKINASLAAQRHTMHKLWDAGFRHQARLSAYLHVCQGTSLLAADVHLQNTPSINTDSTTMVAGHHERMAGTEKPLHKQRAAQLHLPGKHQRLEVQGHM